MKNYSLAFLLLLPVLESLPVLLLLAVLSPRTRQGEMLLKLLALVMAGRRASWLELSELSVLLHGRGSPCRGSVSVSELLCRLAPDRLALNLSKQKVFYSCFHLQYCCMCSPSIHTISVCFFFFQEIKRKQESTRNILENQTIHSRPFQNRWRISRPFNYSLLKHWQLSFFKMIFTKHESEH